MWTLVLVILTYLSTFRRLELQISVFIFCIHYNILIECLLLTPNIIHHLIISFEIFCSITIHACVVMFSLLTVFIRWFLLSFFQLVYCYIVRIIKYKSFSVTNTKNFLETLLHFEKSRETFVDLMKFTLTIYSHWTNFLFFSFQNQEIEGRYVFRK